MLSIHMTCSNTGVTYNSLLQKLNIDDNLLPLQQEGQTFGGIGLFISLSAK